MSINEYSPKCNNCVPHLSAAKPVAEIGREIENLRNAVGNLETCFSTLVVAVKPVTCVTTEGKDEAGAVPVKLSTELGESIYAMTQRINALAFNMSDLDKRIEL